MSQENVEIVRRAWEAFMRHCGLPATKKRRPEKGLETPRRRDLAQRAKRMMGLEPTTFCMASRRSSQLSYIRMSA